MTEMRDRLIELFKETEEKPEKTCPNIHTDKSCKGCKYELSRFRCDYNARKVDYLIANGVICPPCKVGDKLYITASGSRAIVESVVLGVWMCEDNISILTIHGTIHNNSLGETVFLTREEAEKECEGK